MVVCLNCGKWGIDTDDEHQPEQPWDEMAERNAPQQLLHEVKVPVR
jgi:hypothetical protein